MRFKIYSSENANLQLHTSMTFVFKELKLTFVVLFYDTLFYTNIMSTNVFGEESVFRLFRFKIFICIPFILFRMLNKFNM